MNMNIRGDVTNNAASGKVLRSITGEHTDPIMDAVTNYAVKLLNEAGRYQEADEMAKVPQRIPMGSAADGTELPGDMEPEK
jgi:hypothetical protein